MPFGAGSVMIKTSNSVAEYIGSYDIHRRRKVAENVAKNPCLPAKRTSRTWRSSWSSWRTTTTCRTSTTTGSRTKVFSSDPLQAGLPDGGPAFCALERGRGRAPFPSGQSSLPRSLWPPHPEGGTVTLTVTVTFTLTLTFTLTVALVAQFLCTKPCNFSRPPIYCEEGMS